jgi:hypothetical protein
MEHTLLPDIALPSGVARQITPLWETMVRALAHFMTRFGAPADARRQNCCEGHFLGRTITTLRRLQKIVRCILIVYAARLLKTAPPPETTPVTYTRGVCHRERTHREIAGDPATWRVGFVIPPRYRPFLPLHPEPQPERLARAARNPFLTIARKMEALRRVLNAPMGHIRRLARLLRRDIFYMPRRRSKRKPRARGRDYFAEHCDAAAAAAWAIHPLNTS